MINALSGKKIHEVIRDGEKKFASVPSGGAAVASAPAAPAEAKGAAPKKEEKPKEEDVDVGGMGDLFGGDY